MPERKLGVVIVADASKFISGRKNASKETSTLREGISSLDVKVKESAETQVAAAVKSQARLREQVAVYRQIGAAAEKGSREQIAAANLASQAEKRLASSLGVSAHEARSFGASASRAEQEVSRAGRGALAGSGAFRGLGRSVAFASSWFLGGVGLTAAVKGSIEAASGLQEQMQRTNAVFGQSAAGVKAWSTTSALSRGVARAAALDAANTVGTLLQNVGQTPAKAAGMSKAIVKLASDMAAFKKVKPEVALSALEAALTGRTRGLKQFGLVIDNQAIKAQAIASGILKSNVDPGKVKDDLAKVALANAKLGDATKKHGAGSEQAAQATIGLHNAQRQLAKDMAGSTGALTSQQKALATYQLIMKQTTVQRGAFARNSGELAIKEQVFHAALQNTEAIVGTALLPTITRYVGGLGTWLSSSKNQARIQHDVTVAVRYFNEAIGIAERGVRMAAGAFREFAGAVGGGKNAIEIIGGALVAWKIGSRLVSITRDVKALRLALLALSGTKLKLPGLPGGKGTGGTSLAEGAAEDAGGLTFGAAAGIGAAYAAPIVIAGLLSTKPKHIGSTLPGGQGSQIALMPDGSTVIVGPKGTVAYNGTFYPDGSKKQVTTASVQAAIKAKSQPDVNPSTNPKALGPVALKQHYQTGTQGNERKAAAGRAAAARTSARAAGSGTPISTTPTPTSTPDSDTFDLPYNIQLDQAKADASGSVAASQKVARETIAFAKSQIDSGKLSHQALLQAYEDLASARQSLGTAGADVPINLQVGAAKAGITKTNADDVKAAKQIRAFEFAIIKSRHLQGQALIDAYNTIAQENSIIGDQTAKTGRLVSARELTAGLGLSAAKRREAEERIAQAIAHGGHKPTGHTVLGQTITVHTDIHLDGQKIAETVTKHQQRQSRHHVVTSRGPNAGRGHPLT